MKRTRHPLSLLSTILTIYCICLFIIAGIACFFARKEREETFRAHQESITSDLKFDYKQTLDSFWKLYLPLFEESSTVYNTLEQYFTNHETSPLSVSGVGQALRQMIVRQDSVAWIAVFDPDREENYYILPSSNNLSVLPKDIPVLQDLEMNRSPLTVVGSEQFSFISQKRSYVIIGNIPAEFGKGKILVGFTSDSLIKDCSRNDFTFSSLRYQILSGSSVIFDSNNDPTAVLGTILPEDTDLSLLSHGEFNGYSVECESAGNSDSYLLCIYKASEYDKYCHHYSLSIFLITGGLFLFSLLFFIHYARKTDLQRLKIQNGLTLIARNQLDHRIDTEPLDHNYAQIAESINQMSEQLQNNVDKLYRYEILALDARLAELQAKFNPHFLYNSLEMLCNRCYMNHDSETADLIVQLSSIFRGMLSSESFVTLEQELNFSKKYLALFKARYKDFTHIYYDFEPELLQQGIIRSMLQPLIENYFVHGIDTMRQDNEICLRGYSLDEYHFVISIEDNGLGLSEQEMQELRTHLNDPLKNVNKSYGLSNLHQRLKLFYGKDYGIEISSGKQSGEARGFCVSMRLKKMTVEQMKQC